MPLNPKMLKQLALPGMDDTLRGVREVRPGLYYITPNEASYASRKEFSPLKALKSHMDNLINRDTKLHGFRMSKSQAAAEIGDAGDAHKYELTWAALRDAAMGIDDQDLRLLMAVNKQGRPTAAASFDANTGDMLLNILDFTAPSTGQLHHLGVLADTEDDVRAMSGAGMVRAVQDALGSPRMAFEVMDHEDYKNIDFYKKLGAHFADAPRGKQNNPVMLLDDWVQPRKAAPVDIEQHGQQRLPGFSKGGALKSLLRSNKSNPAWFKADVASTVMNARTAEETARAQELLDFTQRIKNLKGTTPEEYDALRRSLHRPVPEAVPAEQLRFEGEGFAGGGKVGHALKYFTSKNGAQRPLWLHDSPASSEVSALGALGLRARLGLRPTEQELEAASGVATYPVYARPLQERSHHTGDLESLLSGDNFCSGGRAMR